MTKLKIVGAEHWLKRAYDSCTAYQWAREWLVNAIEARADWVEFGVEWEAVRLHDVYRRTIADNGCGMSADELRQYFSALGVGSKPIGGAHENFGIGAKIASLAWNPDGVVVISYKAGTASMIWMRREAGGDQYELVEFPTNEGKDTVVDPTTIVYEDGTVNWGLVKPGPIMDHGTIVVLLGSPEAPDTILGDPTGDEGGIKGLYSYLNQRFWELPLEVWVSEFLRGLDRTLWPRTKEQTAGTLPGARQRKISRRRRVRGAHSWVLEDEPGSAVHGVEWLDGGLVRAEWYLWEGARPKSWGESARERGYVAIRYNNELYNVSNKHAVFRYFGIIEKAVQNQVTIILEPDLLHHEPQPERGASPDQSRSKLLFTRRGQKNVGVPMTEWGQEFAKQLPTPILEAITRVRGELGGSLTDDSYRKRLQDQFGERFSSPVLVTPTKPVDRSVPGGQTLDDVKVLVGDYPELDRGRRRSREGRRSRRVTPPSAVTLKVSQNGSDPVAPRKERLDIPRYRWVTADNFEEEWHLALWAPLDPLGPTVLLNEESPIAREAVRHHTERYAVVHEEEVAGLVKQVLGEIAVCRVAHSQSLLRKMPMTELNHKYRSEEALTISLMGLLAEEAVIAHRLVKFGPKIH